MSMYDLNQPDNSTQAVTQDAKKKAPLGVIILVLLALAVGFGLGGASWDKISSITGTAVPTAKDPALAQDYEPQTTQEEAVMRVVKDYSPAVVSIIITKDIPVYERYYSTPRRGFDPFGFWDNFQVPEIRQKGTQQKQVGAGTGFIVSEDGVTVTNKHVVSDPGAQYTAITVDGKKYSAKVLALDPVQDLAIVKIEDSGGKKFPTVKLGDSSNLQIGQSVIAIGNALGEFNNTVSVGVISGLQRSIVAGSVQGTSETLENLIQTDAAINEGNSGGPLLNLKGEVIGVNTAMASGAQAVGFVIPINAAKRDIAQVEKSGKITYPFLGINYTMVNDQIQEEKSLPVNYGALISAPSSEGESAIVAGSPAQKAGLKDGDIILEFNGEKLTQNNPLSQVIAKYNPGDKVTLKVRRQGQEINLTATLSQRPAESE